jgi:hypothetical protein
MRRETGLSEDDELECLLFDGIAKDVMRGEISQLHRQFLVVYSRARDCRPNEQGLLLEKLNEM